MLDAVMPFALIVLSHCTPGERIRALVGVLVDAGTSGFIVR